MAYPLANERLRELAWDLAGAIETATLALVRFDERLGRSDPALADGVRARADFGEAQALAHLAGELAPLEDLVLHNAGMDARAPGAGTVRAARHLAERRSLALRPPEAVLKPTALRCLLGLGAQARAGAADWAIDAGDGLADGAGPALTARRNGPPALEARAWETPRPLAEAMDDASGDDEPASEDLTADGGGEFAAIDALLGRTSRTLFIVRETEGPPSLRLRDPLYGAEERLAAWLTVLDRSRPLPGSLAVALALDAWLALEPAERCGEIGWALAATVLRDRRLAEHHLPALALAYRKGRFRWSSHLPLERRLEGLLAAVCESARLADADLKRLTLARELMLRRCAGRRGNSRLGELVGLFVELPLVTVALAADRLKVSPQAVEAMLKELGPALPRELTGRKRYRAWGTV